jgi:hypothetical protein
MPAYFLMGFLAATAVSFAADAVHAADAVKAAEALNATAALKIADIAAPELAPSIVAGDSLASAVDIRIGELDLSMIELQSYGDLEDTAR